MNMKTFPIKYVPIKILNIAVIRNHNDHNESSPKLTFI